MREFKAFGVKVGGHHSPPHANMLEVPQELPHACLLTPPTPPPCSYSDCHPSPCAHHPCMSYAPIAHMSSPRQVIETSEPFPKGPEEEKDFWEGEKFQVRTHCWLPHGFLS